MALPAAEKKNKNEAVTFEVILKPAPSTGCLDAQDVIGFILQPGGVVCHHLCSAPEPRPGLLSPSVPWCNVQRCCQNTEPAGLFILHSAKMLLNCTIQISSRKIARLFFSHKISQFAGVCNCKECKASHSSD